jgi:hypothetical protein
MIPESEPLCRICHHAKASHFHATGIGDFCKECPIENNVWEHDYEPDRRMDDRRKVNFKREPIVAGNKVVSTGKRSGADRR